MAAICGFGEWAKKGEGKFRKRGRVLKYSERCLLKKPRSIHLGEIGLYSIY
jgi:hypothetical protein